MKREHLLLTDWLAALDARQTADIDSLASGKI